MHTYISHVSAGSQLWPPTPPTPSATSTQLLVVPSFILFLWSSRRPGRPASVYRLIGRIVWLTDWTTYWCIDHPNWMTVSWPNHVSAQMLLISRSQPWQTPLPSLFSLL